MSLKRKIATYSLLLIVSAPLYFAFSFELHQRSIQRKMKEELAEKMLQTITLNNAQFHWVREKREIVINDQLFDVKSYSFNDDGSVVITGLFDKEETSLVQTFQKSQQRSGAEKQLAQFFQMQLSMPSPLTAMATSNTNINNFSFSYFAGNISSVYLGIITPPPQA